MFRMNFDIGTCVGGSVGTQLLVTNVRPSSHGFNPFVSAGCPLARGSGCVSSKKEILLCFILQNK